MRDYKNELLSRVREISKQETRDKLYDVLELLRDVKDNNTVFDKLECKYLNKAYNIINNARYNIRIETN